MRLNIIYSFVVLTRWRRWGRSMDFPSFCSISLKGLKGDSASSCSQGPTWSSSLRIRNEGTLWDLPTPTTIHMRSILDLTNCSSYLFYILNNPSLSQLSLSMAPHCFEKVSHWFKYKSNCNRNNPIARAKLYQLSFNCQKIRTIPIY